MRLGDFVDWNSSLQKLFGTNRIEDWKEALAVADFEVDLNPELEKFNKGLAAINMKYQRLAKKHDPKINADGQEMFLLTEDEVEKKQNELEELRNTDIRIDVPVLTEKTVKALYADFKKDEMEESERFVGHDLAAFRQLGLLKGKMADVLKKDSAEG